MEAPPISFQPEAESEWTEKEIAAGGRSVVVAFAPVVDDFQFFTNMRGERPVPDIALSEPLLKTAEEFANAGPGNVYYEAHVNYLKRVLGVVELGGSALVSSKFGQMAIHVTERYPDKLFNQLDHDWREFAEELGRDDTRLVVPPVLSIVLSRAARRDAIPAVICDLRAEWAVARQKIWNLLGELRNSDTVQQARDIHHELGLASQLFSPNEDDRGTDPLRLLWEILAVTAGGAAIAMISGGKPAIGAATSGLGYSAHSITPWIREHGAMIFRRGAFDLARRVQDATRVVELRALPRLLGEDENRKLGFS